MMLIIAYALTKILKWNFTSSFVVFCVSMFFLCDESRLLFVIFAIIVQVQVQHLKKLRLKTI